MYLEHVSCFTNEESSVECTEMCRKGSKNVNKVVFWLTYKIVIYYIIANRGKKCNRGKRAKDILCIWKISIILKL
jgi:hypothetical protein